MGDWGLGDDTDVPDINIKRKCESCEGGTGYEGLEQWLDGYIEWEDLAGHVYCETQGGSTIPRYKPKCGYYNEELMTWDEVLQEDSRTYGGYSGTFVAAEDGSGLADEAAREDIFDEAFEEW